MCELATVGMAAQGFATVMKANAERAQGQAIFRQKNLEADISERAASDALERGKQLDMQVVARSSAVIAEQRLIAGASGVDANTGGALQARLASDAVSSVDRATVARNAVLTAIGYRFKASSEREQGTYALKEAEDAANGTFLSGLAGFAGMGGKFLVDRKFDASSADTSYGGGPFADEAD